METSELKAVFRRMADQARDKAFWMEVVQPFRETAQLIAAPARSPQDHSGGTHPPGIIGDDDDYERARSGPIVRRGVVAGAALAALVFGGLGFWIGGIGGAFIFGVPGGLLGGYAGFYWGVVLALYLDSLPDLPHFSARSLWFAAGLPVALFLFTLLLWGVGR